MAPVAVMVLLGASLVSMRGFVLADTPDESQASAANPIKVVSKTEVSKRSKASQFPGFHREAIWPAEITQNRHGMFVLRVGELQEQPQLAPFIGLVEAQLNEVVELSLDRASKPGLDLRNVDWIATQATFTLKNNARPQADEKHSLALGTNGLIIRFKESVSLQDWVNKNMNDLERAVLEGQTIFQISTLPAATDVPLKSWMRQIDQNTVQISLYARSEESDSNLATIFGGQPDIPKEHLTSWHRVSRSLNRGLIAFVHTDAEIRRSIDIDDTGSNLLQTVSRLAAALTQRCTTFGYGIDIDEDGKFIV